MINYQEIFVKSLLSGYEAAWPLFVLILCIALGLHIFRYEIAHTHRQLKKLENSIISFIAIPVVVTLGYLIINQYFFLLFAFLLVFALYVVYKFGLFDEYFG